MPDKLRPSQRLRRPSEFKRVFSSGRRVHGGPFVVVFWQNQHGAPRLGLSIAKRHARRAVDRNRIKRQIREDFRHRASKLPALDCVVYLSRSGDSNGNATLRSALDGAWRKVKHTCASSSSA